VKLLQDKSCKELAGTLPSNVNVNQEVVRSVTTPLRKRRGVVTALDQLMPHPVYGRMFWVCVLNPSDVTFQKVQPPKPENRACISSDSTM